MRGRKPVPTALKLIRGNPGHRKINKDEPVPDTVAPEMPAFFGEFEAEAWNYLVSELGKMGILASSDRGEMSIYCDAWGRYARNKSHIRDVDGGLEVITTKQGNRIQNPHLGICNRALEDLARSGANLGLNPIQRTRIHQEKKEPKSRREKLLG